MLTKWAMVGLCNDSEDAIVVNMIHKDLKVIALALREVEDGHLEELIARIANDPTWDHAQCKHRWNNPSYPKYSIPDRNKC
jgi:hypothetical protein